MWFAYLDEAGNTGANLNDQQQPIHLIAGLLVPEARIRDVHGAVAEIEERHFPDLARQNDFEFHGSHLVQASGLFRDQPVDKRLDALQDLMGIVSRLDLRLLVKGVDKIRLAARYPRPHHPHDLVMRHIVEEAERIARAKSAEGEACRFLLVADEMRGRHRRLLAEFRSLQQHGSVWGYWPVDEVRHVIDTIHFVESHTSRPLQVADCVAYLALREHRMQRRELDPNTRLNNRLHTIWANLLQPHVENFYVWNP